MPKTTARALRAVVSVGIAVGLLGLGADPAHAQPLEDQFTDPGPWPGIVYDNGNPGECDPGVAPTQDHTFVYTSAVGAFGPHPVVVFGTGRNVFGASQDPVCNYRPLLEHWASWGFIVVAPNASDTAIGNGTALIDAVDDIVNLNGDSSSPFFGNVDTANVATSGHSLGATGAVNAANDSTVPIKSVLATSHSYPPWIPAQPDWAALTQPVFLMRGGATGFQDDFFSPENLNVDWFNAVSGPAAKATVCGDDLPGTDCSVGEGHTHSNLANAVPYGTAWLAYTLMDGAFDSADVFVGSSPEIATNDGWENWQSKNLT